MQHLCCCKGCTRGEASPIRIAAVRHSGSTATLQSGTGSRTVRPDQQPPRNHARPGGSRCSAKNLLETRRRCTDKKRHASSNVLNHIGTSLSLVCGFNDALLLGTAWWVSHPSLSPESSSCMGTCPLCGSECVRLFGRNSMMGPRFAFPSPQQRSCSISLSSAPCCNQNCG